MLGGGPRGFDEAAMLTSLTLAWLGRRWEPVLVRALDERRDGGPDEVSVAVVVCRLCASMSLSSKQLVRELGDSCELLHVCSEASDRRCGLCSIRCDFGGGMGRAWI